MVWYCMYKLVVLVTTSNNLVQACLQLQFQGYNNLATTLSQPFNNLVINDNPEQLCLFYMGSFEIPEGHN